MSDKYDYDVVIIGAGISGLVCGCYLAKAGLKTLIVEKNAKPGGYCTSFTRGGYHFDACAHGLGSLRPRGRLDKLFHELGLYKKLKIVRKDPSDIVFTPKHKIYIFNSIDKTIGEFQKAFPKERNQIVKFINYVTSSNMHEFTKHRSKTLQQLLDEFFQDNALKTIFSIFILGFGGCPPNEVSAVVACLIFREFVFDGGYIPSGGMQDLPDALMLRFIELNGEIKLHKTVKGIILDNSCVTGVVLNTKEKIYSRCIVSACDLRQTFLQLIGADNLSGRIVKRIKKVEPSMSSFLVYLGMNSSYRCLPEQNAHIWIINNLDMKSAYSNMLKQDNDCLLLTTSVQDSDKNKKERNISVRLESTIPCMDSGFWTQEKCEVVSTKFIELTKTIFPDISRNISFKITASPKTLYKWTNNYKGASFGWASLPKQFGNPDFTQKTEMRNLFITGHWSNQSSGIAFVVNCGFNTAQSVLHRMKHK